MPVVSSDPPTAGAPTLPRLFCAPHLRCVEVSGRLVILDLTAGAYDIVDEVGTAMWSQLLQSPADRDTAGLADTYGVPTALVESDLADFASAQLATGRLLAAPPPVAVPSVPSAPRMRPTRWRALRERAAADRELRAGFAGAYTKRTTPPADPSPPRVGLDRLIKTFSGAENLYPAPEAPLDCLPRSLALTWFLRTSGWPAEHVIGVALYPFEAHAWVECAGTALNEGATFLQRFTVIQRA